MKSLREVTLSEFQEALMLPVLSRGMTMDAIRNLQVIQVALAFGTLSFGVIVVVLTMSRSGKATTAAASNLAETMSLVNGAYFVLSFAISAVVNNAIFSRAALNKQSDDPAQQCVALIRNASIVRLAIHESSAFIGLVTCMLIFQNSAQPVYWLNALPALVELLIVAITFPSRQRFEDVFRQKIQNALP
jgi:hypothetical protein